jgi:hypothetical protein
LAPGEWRGPGTHLELRGRGRRARPRALGRRRAGRAARGGGQQQALDRREAGHRLAADGEQHVAVAQHLGRVRLRGATAHTQRLRPAPGARRGAARQRAAGWRPAPAYALI